MSKGNGFLGPGGTRRRLCIHLEIDLVREIVQIRMRGIFGNFFHDISKPFVLYRGSWQDLRKVAV